MRGEGLKPSPSPTSCVSSLTESPPLSLYIHLPWCVRKCPYCDFSSFESHQGVPEQEYVAALLKDLEAALPQVWGRKIVSIFIGGGTPSLFSASAIDRLLTQVRTLLPVEAHAEITLEANPGTAEAQKFAGFRAAGVNRLSLGIQSFNPRHLQALGRIHDDRDARAAVELALRHFDNVNLDLMYGLPGQGVDEALADIRAAIAFDPQHISAYHLTLEPNTVFYSKPPQLPDDDMAAAMQEGIEAELAAAGYEHYETSAFAKKNRRCRHNLNYWSFGDYLGIGAAAHGKLTFHPQGVGRGCKADESATTTLHNRILRQVRSRQPKAYMERALAGNAVEEEHEVAPQELPFEFMMNALRLTGGFPSALLAARIGMSSDATLAALKEAERRGLVERDESHIRPTLLGRRFLNDLLQLFLP